jgi:hypothetical protein
MATAKPAKKKPAEKVDKISEMLIALSESDGLVSEALAKCGATFADHKGWLANDESYKLRLEEIKERKKDKYERCALDAAESGNANVITNVMKTFCKDRGYGADGEVPVFDGVIRVGYADGV